MSDPFQRFVRLVEQYPGNEMARFSLGKAYFDAGRHLDARSQFIEALAKRTDWMVVAILIAKCDLALGDVASARVHLEKALQLAIEQNHEGPMVEVKEMLQSLPDNSKT